MKLKITRDIAVILFSAFLSAAALHIFVYTASFSPSGIDGIATMLQSKTGFNAGFTTVILNTPLLIAAWFSLNKKYVYYCMLYTAVASSLIVLFKYVDFYQYRANTDKLIPAVFSGLILGARTGFMIKIGSSTGGIDIIAGLIQKKQPYRNVENFISFLSYIIIVAAFFVYRNLESVMLTVAQIFVAERVIGGILRSSRSAVEFKIITKEPEVLKSDILSVIKHGATFIETTGMFTGESSTMIICVVNTYQIGDFIKVVKNHPGTFAVFSDINGVVGNFRWEKGEEPK